MSDFNMNYEEMRDTATKFHNGKDAIDTVLDELRQNSSDLTAEGFTTQVASDQFDGNVEDLISQLKDAGDALDAIADQLDLMVQSTEEYDEVLAGG
ncbi:WXG100 family type VII secretion target [Georgenia alba]|uniref:WXG100 family type VII secretion target n=1 Tax=Georgenia alba TaxID=2233858 RepID=A0ABW2Q6B3_9MICO